MNIRKCLSLLVALAFLLSLGAMGPAALAEETRQDAQTVEGKTHVNGDTLNGGDWGGDNGGGGNDDGGESGPTPTPEEPANDTARPKRKGKVLIQGEDERLLVIGGPYGDIEIRNEEGSLLYCESDREILSSSLVIRTEESQRVISLELDRSYQVSITAGNDGPLGLCLYSFYGSELYRLFALDQEHRVKAGESVILTVSGEGMTASGPGQTDWPVRVLEGEEIQILPVTSTELVDGSPQTDSGISNLCRYGEVLELVAPEEEGLRFQGWFRAGEAEPLSENEKFYFFVTEETELEARFISFAFGGQAGASVPTAVDKPGGDLGILLPVLLILLITAGTGLAIFLLLKRRAPETPQQPPAPPKAPETIIQTEPPSLQWAEPDKKQ